MTTATNSKALHIVLWIAQVILAGMFIMAGVMKSTAPIEQLLATLPWTNDLPEMVVRFIGVSELLAGLGLLLPSIFKIKPILTPYAAIGLVALMVCAVIYHTSKGEYPAILFNFVLGGVAAFIAWGRLKKVPIVAKK